MALFYVDEIDKIARKSENPSITRDVSVRACSRRCSRCWRARQLTCRRRAAASIRIRNLFRSTQHNILFICGGAFDGIEGIIQKRIGKQGMGFGSEVKSQQEDQTDQLLAQIEPHDLMKYGLIPELIGRLPAVVSLDTLDEKALVRILQEPKNALVKQYQTLLAMDGVMLEFAPDALEEVAKTALARKTGARGLRGVLENVMTDIMFRIPSDTSINRVVITRETVTGEGEPLIEHGGRAALPSGTASPKKGEKTLKTDKKRIKQCKNVGEPLVSPAFFVIWRTRTLYKPRKIYYTDSYLIIFPRVRRETMIETNGVEIKRLPVLPLRGLTAFPHMIIHFDVGRLMSNSCAGSVDEKRPDDFSDRAA